MTVVYIAGPMSGLPELNHPAFHAAARDLRRQGLTVLSPAEIDDGGVQREWSWYMDECIPMVFRADMLMHLEGWEASKGARVEVAVARSRGIPVVAYRLHTPA